MWLNSTINPNLQPGAVRGGMLPGEGGGDERGYQEELRLSRAQKSAPGGQQPQKAEGADLTPCAPTQRHPPRAPHRALGVPVPPPGCCWSAPAGLEATFLSPCQEWGQEPRLETSQAREGPEPKALLRHTEKTQSPQRPRVLPGEEPQGEESGGKSKYKGKKLRAASPGRLQGPKGGFGVPVQLGGGRQGWQSSAWLWGDRVGAGQQRVHRNSTQAPAAGFTWGICSAGGD